MNDKSRPIDSPDIVPGKPVKRETKSGIESILKKLALGMKAYPKLARENIMDSLAYTDDVGAREKDIVFLTS